MAKKDGPSQVLVSLHMPKAVVEALDELVRRGLVASRSEAIRQAVNEYIVKYACAFTALNKGLTGPEPVSEEEAFYSRLIKGRV
jgi:Arc/MetJ-type ribon-helix-helix transcriptional regulator